MPWLLARMPRLFSRGEHCRCADAGCRATCSRGASRAARNFGGVCGSWVRGGELCGSSAVDRGACRDRRRPARARAAHAWGWRDAGDAILGSSRAPVPIPSACERHDCGVVRESCPARAADLARFAVCGSARLRRDGWSCGHGDERAGRPRREEVWALGDVELSRLLECGRPRRIGGLGARNASRHRHAAPVCDRGACPRAGRSGRGAVFAR